MIKKWFLYLMVILTLVGCSSYKTEPSSIQTVNDIDGKTVGLLEGATNFDSLQEKFPNSNIVWLPTYADCIQALLSGKIDTYIADEPTARYQIQANDQLTYLPEIITNEDYAFVLDPSNTELRNEIDDILSKYQEDGTLKDLEREWFDEEIKQELPKIKNSNRVLRVITCVDQEPFAYVKDNQVMGYDIELMIRIGNELGVQVEIEEADFNALIPSVTTEKADIAIGGISTSEERSQVIQFTKNVYIGGCVAMIPKTSTPKSFVDSLKDSFYKNFILEDRYLLIIDGLKITILLSVLTLIFGTILGFLFSFGLRSKYRVIEKISKLLSTFLDSMPLVVTLMILYYVIFQSVNISPVLIGVIGFTLDFANSVANLLNSGIYAIEYGQIEAGQALGYSNIQVFLKIVLPQVIHNIFSQYEGAVVSMIKGTAIIGYITVEDLTKVSDIIRARTYEAFFPLIATAVLYFLIAYLFIFVLRCVSKYFDPKQRPRVVKGVRIHD